MLSSYVLHKRLRLDTDKIQPKYEIIASDSPNRFEQAEFMLSETDEGGDVLR